MDEKNTNLQAEDTLAVLDPESYVLSNPTPRDWNMTAQDIARSLKVTPYESVTTKAQREGDQLNVAETIGTGIWDAIKRLPKSISETIAVANIESYSSPNMTEKEAARLLQDALYTRHFARKAEDVMTAEKIKYNTLYNISGAVGDLVKYVGVGIVGGLPAVATIAGAESFSETEAAMVDSYIEKKGTIEGYEKERGKDVALAGAYGVFSGLTEIALGVERIAAGVLNRYGRMEAASRLARQQGKLYKSAAIQAGRRFGMSALEEGAEEFVQQVGEDVTKYWAGYEDAVFTDENFKKAITAAAYGALIGGPAGWGLYRINRQSIINKLNDWNNKRKIGMSQEQIIESADQILNESKTTMLDEITTRAEIKNGYGEAFDTVKARIAELIDATGTTPWIDQNKTKEQYVEDAAKAVTFPAIIQANKAQLPLSDFLEVADLNVTETSSGKAPILNFVPIATIDDLQRMLDEQNTIIKEESYAAKIGNANPERKQAAQRRKAILQYHIHAKQLENGLQNIKRTRRKEQADYVTAKDLQPEQTATLDTAVQAEEGQDYVLFAGKRIPVEYQVVELSTIQPSHINGTPNPLYTNTALQNRASRGTTQDVADLREKATNITPERLLRATTAAEGAPVVNERGEVIAGNGRAEIVRYAYENPESTEKYKTALANAGFNIEGMEKPILVRKNTTMTDSEQVAAADISNISETSAFDEASQARRDTQYLKDSATPIDFASKLPMSERRGLMQNNGRWNKRRVQQRYEDALLSWLTGNDAQLFENLVLDRGISQKVIDILTNNGAQIYELATKYPELDIREDLYHALQKMQMATRDNFIEITQQVELDGRDVMPENIFIWNWLFTDGTTNRQFMSNYLSTIQKNVEAVNAGQDMFGDKIAPLSKKDALMQALKKTDEARAQTAAERGREYEGLFTQETEEVKNPELAAAIASYNNQFAMQGRTTLSQLAYISGTTFYNRPSTKYVLRGGEGQIVHGWGIYALKDKEKNKARYREGQFAGKYVFVPNIPKYQQLIKGAKNQKESQIFKMVLDTIAGRTPINMHKQIGFAGGISSYVPIFYLDALYEVMGENTNKADKTFLEKVISKGQLADETIFKVDPKMSKWLQRAIVETLDMHNDLKNSKFYKKDLPYIFVNAITLDAVQKDFLDFIKKDFKHKDLNAKANQELANRIIEYVSESGRIKYEPFDNSIFEEAGAQVIDYKEMESDTQVIIEKLRDTLYGGYREMASIDDIIKRFPEKYSGYLGLAAIISKVPFSSPTDLMFRINNGKTTLENIEKDPDFKYMKDEVEKPGVKLINPAYKFIVSIVNSAKKKFDSKKFKTENSELPEDAQTWLALSQAMRNMSQKETDSLGLFLFTAYGIPEEKLDLFVQILQHPENIKQTRGQQLEIDVPEDNMLLNEDLTLKSQPAAAKLRGIITDWHWDFSREMIHNIREPSWIKKHLDSDWKIFAAKHGLDQNESIDDFVERLFNEHMETFDQTMTKERELLVDYIMETMHGEGLYNALADIIPETYIELESGEEIGEDKDYDGKDYTVMGARMPAELARDVALYLNDQGIKGIKYRGGIDEDGFVIFSDEAIQTLRRMDDELPMYYQRRGQPLGFYDPELQAIVLGKNWNETTLVHEFHHRYLEKIWGIYKQATAGVKTVAPAFMEDTQKLFEMLEIDPKQDQLTAVQQEKFASMVEAYLTGLGVDNADNLAFKAFLHWIPEKYKSVMDIGYLDEQGNIQNPFLDQESIDFFDKWFASPFAPSLPSAPQAQRLVNVTDDKDQIIPSTQKVMNNREKEWGQDSEEQNKADAQLWRAIGENNPSNIRAAMDGEQELMKAEAKEMEDDRILPEKPSLRDKWFKARQPDARALAAEKAREYLAKNPEHARELAFADPETMTKFDAPVDHGMLIRAVMETVPHGSDKWYILDNNLAMVKSMSGSTLSLSGDLSHQAYLDAKREVEYAREMKAAVNYAGTREGAMEKWNSDIRAFTAKRVAAIMATEPNSQERKVAIEAFLEEAKTKFSGNTTNAILNQLDLTGMKTKNSQAFIKWAENQIKQAAHAKIDTKEQAELMKASVKAQLALRDINSTEQKDGKFARAVQSAKDIRHWQFVKDKMKKAYIGRWGKFGIWADNLFGGYMPSAMLMSVNTLFFANVPSTAINTGIVRASATAIGKNAVNEQVQKDEIKRITQIFNGSGINLAQMEKPTSPSLLHGEKYTNQEQAHWYNFTFEILGRTDNLFRIPTFVDTLARIATKNANGDSAKATVLFKEYIKLGNTNEDAQIARKQALAVANMAVFTQDGTMASALNHIRSQLNTMSRGFLGLEPGGFGLGNVLAPFLKTGANIVEMGLKATAAPIRQLIQWGKKAQGKQIPDIDKLAMRVDWTYFAFTAVVTTLMAAITSDDDEWYIEPYKPGTRYDPNRPYDSIKIAGVWVKLDIFGPLEVPLRTAAMLVKDWDEKQMAALGDGLMEALGETPLVNQFMDNSMDYAAKQPGKWASSFAYNQINKLMPAQLKSISRAGSRAAGKELDVKALGKTIERKFHRNYGLDGQQLTTNDLINLLTNRLKTNPE